MCTFVAEILTLQNVSIMKTDFYEDWPHPELRLRLEFVVNADELEELFEFLDGSELRYCKSPKVYDEFMDFLLEAKRTFNDFQRLRYRDNGTY
jgi:hypothetical protein